MINNKEFNDLVKNKNLSDSIIYSLQAFFHNDLKLIENTIHEQTISHRIAFYLECYFKSKNLNNLSFDCEYNKKGDTKGEIDSKKFTSKKLNEKSFSPYNIILKDGKELEKECIEFFSDENYSLFYIKDGFFLIGRKNNNEIIISYKKLKNSEIRPDIIIHERGNNKNNLCVFEIKKDNLDSKDKLKLQGFTSGELNFGYKYGIGLSNFKNGDEKEIKITLYIDGMQKDIFCYNYKINKIKKLI